VRSVVLWRARPPIGRVTLHCTVLIALYCMFFRQAPLTVRSDFRKALAAPRCWAELLLHMHTG
jgi:hypothetical protein